MKSFHAAGRRAAALLAAAAVLAAHARAADTGLQVVPAPGAIPEAPEAEPAATNLWSRNADNRYVTIDLVSSVMMAIREHYVDEDAATFQEIGYGALRGMLSALDPHSQFMTPEDYREMREETGGAFAGIGINVGKKDGFITVISPVEGTPAHTAGILAGDRIIRIDGKSTERFSLDDAVKRLRGRRGDEVKLTVLRPNGGVGKIKEFILVRDIIPMLSVRDSRLLPGAVTGGEKIGYLRIVQFSEPTASEVRRAAEKLAADGATALVLDLRNNPGGLLESAADTAGLFVPAGEVIVSTEGRGSQSRSVLKSGAGRKLPDMPLAVLVNEGSASGAEIVAGALKDLRKAVLVGETTFGKGSVQSILPLPDGSAVRLTTAHYYTPAHEIIHEKGVRPHIFVPLDAAERERMARAFFEHSDKKPREMADSQLRRAVDALRGARLHLSRANGGTAAPAEDKAPAQTARR